MVVIVVGLVWTVAADGLQPWLQRLRQLRLEQALAAVRAADTLHHARCLQQGARGCRVVLTDGRPVADAFAHPAASEDGIVRAANLGELGVQWRASLRHALPVLTIQVPTPSGAGCDFTYVQASVWGAQPGIDEYRASCR